MINGKLFLVSETLAIALCVLCSVLGFFGSLLFGVHNGLDPFQTGVLCIGTSAPLGLSQDLQGWFRKKIYVFLMGRQVLRDYQATNIRRK